MKPEHCRSIFFMYAYQAEILLFDFFFIVTFGLITTFHCRVKFLRKKINSQQKIRKFLNHCLSVRHKKQQILQIMLNFFVISFDKKHEYGYNQQLLTTSLNINAYSVYEFYKLQLHLHTSPSKNICQLRNFATPLILVLIFFKQYPSLVLMIGC